MYLAAFLPTAFGLSSAYRWGQAFLYMHSGNSDDEYLLSRLEFCLCFHIDNQTNDFFLFCAVRRFRCDCVKANIVKQCSLGQRRMELSILLHSSPLLYHRQLIISEPTNVRFTFQSVLSRFLSASHPLS